MKVIVLYILLITNGYIMLDGLRLLARKPWDQVVPYFLYGTLSFFVILETILINYR